MPARRSGRNVGAWARKHPFAFYYAVALLIACGVMVAYAALLARDPAASGTLPALFAWLDAHRLHVNALSIAVFAFASGSASVLLILLFAGAPTLAALATSAVAWGGAGVRRWLARLRPWGQGVTRRDALHVYGVLALVYFGVLGAYLGFTWASAPPESWAKTWAVFGGSLPAALAIAAASAFLDEGGLLEEMGWRGFGLPLLQERMSPLAAAVTLGLLWCAWHLPREVPNLLGGAAPLATWIANQALFALLCVAISIVAAFAVNRTGGSVLPAIVVHGGSNVWSKAASTHVYATLHTDVRTWILVAAAALVVALAGRDLGRR